MTDSSPESTTRANRFAPDPSAEELSLTLRNALISRILFGVMILACVGAPVSASRAWFTGWLPLYTAHLAIAASIIALWLLRDRVNPNLQALIILTLFWAVGLSGLLSLGLMGAGAWWLVSSALLVNIIYSVRAGLAVMAAIALLVVGVGSAFILGTLTPLTDLNAFIAEPAAWATFIIGAVALPLVIFSAVGALQNSNANLLHTVSEQKKEILHLAQHDELTGLPRAILAEDRLHNALQRRQRSGKKVMVLFLDLDGFKAVNDTYGHAAGDFLLQTLAGRLRQLLREGDTIARKGGDEFLAILEHVDSIVDARLVATKIAASVQQPCEFEGQKLSVGSSIGIAMAPDNGHDAATLINAADQAMYRAKKSDKERICVAVQAA